MTDKNLITEIKIDADSCINNHEFFKQYSSKKGLLLLLRILDIYTRDLENFLTANSKQVMGFNQLISAIDWSLKKIGEYCKRSNETTSFDELINNSGDFDEETINSLDNFWRECKKYLHIKSLFTTLNKRFARIKIDETNHRVKISQKRSINNPFLVRQRMAEETSSDETYKNPPFGSNLTDVKYESTLSWINTNIFSELNNNFSVDDYTIKEFRKVWAMLFVDCFQVVQETSIGSAIYSMAENDFIERIHRLTNVSENSVKNYW